MWDNALQVDEILILVVFRHNSVVVEVRGTVVLTQIQLTQFRTTPNQHPELRMWHLEQAQTLLLT